MSILDETCGEDTLAAWDVTTRLVALYRFFRSHPNTPWEHLQLTALNDGYTGEEVDLVGWCVWIESVRAAEENLMCLDVRRN